MNDYILPKFLDKVTIPPIKCQGIKTKLVQWILSNSILHKESTWVEPFLGSGVVGFNSGARHALMNDINPHIINFYISLQSNLINEFIIREYLEKEGYFLSTKGESHYYKIRDRFNAKHDPLDFLFLSRAGFNGVMRFNSHGLFNIPFCKKPNRFSKSYITKIVNQVSAIQFIIQKNSWKFTNKDFEAIITSAKSNDFIYCDPPYYGRHVDYYNSWNESSELKLYELLKSLKTNFILSTWHSNKYRKNPNIEKLWSKFKILTGEHFYHIGAKEINRNSIKEAIILNFEPFNEIDFGLKQLTIWDNKTYQVST